MHKQYLTEKDVSQYSGYSRSTLQHWRWKGEGPRFKKVKNRVLYPLEEIQSYFAEFPLQQSTSQTTKSIEANIYTESNSHNMGAVK